MTIPIGLLSRPWLRRAGLVALAALFVVSWSSGFLIPKAIPVETPILTVLLWRFLLVAVALLVVVAVRRRAGVRAEACARAGEQGGAATRASRIPRRALLRQALIGLFTQVGYVLPIYLAILLGVASGTTALIDAVQPLVVATLVGPLLGLRVRGAQWAGLGLGALGVAFVVGSQAASASAPFAAYLLPLVAMASLIAGTFLERRRPAPLPVLLTLAVHATVATLVFGALAVITGTAVPPATLEFWAMTLLLALSPTLTAYLLYWVLLARLGITALNALLFLVAPATALGGSLLFGEPLGVVTLLGFALCALGVTVVLRSGAAEARGAAAESTGRRAEAPAPVTALQGGPAAR